MITCPRCGAENKPEATVCRMCATTLDPAAAMHGAPRPPQPPAQEIPATVLIPSPGAPAGGPTQGGTSGKVTCPGCQAANDADWAFCQQCGTRLHATPPQPVMPAPNWGAPTVVTPGPGYGVPPPPPGADPRFAPTVVTPASVPPPDLPTVVTPPQAVPQPPQPPAHDPSLFAPTVVTPVPEFPAPPPPPQRAPAPQPPPPPSGAPTDKFSVAGPAPTPPPAPAPPAPPAPTPQPLPISSADRPTDGAGMMFSPQPPAPPAPGSDRTMVMSSSPVAAPPRQGRLHLIMEGGETGDTYDLRPSETVIGRVDGDIKFPHDGYMSGRHARVIQRNGRFYLIDNNSRNGTFIKIHQEVELNPGDVILVGKQLFRFEADE